MNKLWHRKRDSGRWTVSCRDGRNYLWYRVVMWNEIGRELRSDELVHHINGDPGDDRVENLMMVTRAEHFRIHREQGEFEHVLISLRTASAAANAARDRKVTLICDACGSEFRRSRSKVKGKVGNFCSYPCKVTFQTGRSLKLSPAQIDAILASDKSNRELGRELGVSHHAIGRCKRTAA